MHRQSRFRQGSRMKQRPTPRHAAPATARTLLAAAIAVLIAAPALAQSSLPYPRLANLFLPTLVDTTMIDALAKWDVAIVNSIWTDAQLARLRQRNPNIKIYFYTIVYAVELPPAA